MLLESIGIPRAQFQIITEPTRFSRVFVPDVCFGIIQGKQRYTQEYAHLIHRLAQIPPPPRKPAIEKVYFSRTAFQSQKDFNEKAIENFFKNQGFEIIYPEKNTFLENLAILQNAKVFAATDGSIAHNLLFCKDGTLAIVLRKSRNFTIHQMCINHLKKADVLYIDAAFSPLADCRKVWEAGPFFLYETKYLSRFFGLKPKAFPWHLFFNYLRLCLPSFINNELLSWTHPIRGKLQIGTHLRRFFHGFKNIFKKR